MHEHTAGKTITVDADERLPGALAIPYDSVQHKAVNGKQEKTACKPPFLTHGAEDEVRALFRHKTIGSLGALEITLAEKAALTYIYQSVADMRAYAT